jgi:hypothetical protein
VVHDIGDKKRSEKTSQALREGPSLEKKLAKWEALQDCHSWKENQFRWADPYNNSNNNSDHNYSEGNGMMPPRLSGLACNSGNKLWLFLYF